MKTQTSQQRGVASQGGSRKDQILHHLDLVCLSLQILCLVAVYFGLCYFWLPLLSCPLLSPLLICPLICASTCSATLRSTVMCWKRGTAAASTDATEGTRCPPGHPKSRHRHRRHVVDLCSSQACRFPRHCPNECSHNLRTQIMWHFWLPWQLRHIILNRVPKRNWATDPSCCGNIF